VILSLIPEKYRLLIVVSCFLLLCMGFLLVGGGIYIKSLERRIQGEMSRQYQDKIEMLQGSNETLASQVKILEKSEAQAIAEKAEIEKSIRETNEKVAAIKSFNGLADFARGLSGP